MHSTIVKKIILFFLCTLTLASCNGWTVQPLPYKPPTPFSPPSRTPAINSPTPVAIGMTASATPIISISTATPSSLPPGTHTPTNTAVPTPTSQELIAMLRIVILGCNTGIDISHGMGEVTNAYINIQNTGNVELVNLTITLYALDEGREHPDTIQEIPLIPVNYEVMLKMTVDSTYKEESPIQVEVNSAQGLFPREGIDSCRDLGLFVPNPSGLNTPVPSSTQLFIAS